MDPSRRIVSYRPDQLTAKMTPEMNRAIKRQERNAGYDYWKSGFSGNGPTSPHDKRPTFQNLAQINLNFPGIFLPNLDSVSSKPRRRESSSNFSSTTTQPVVLRRSNSMVSTTPLRRVTHQTQNTNDSRKPLTDLTCLQLTDTLLSYSGASLPGLSLFRTPSNRSRFMDYLCDDRNVSEADESHERESNTSVDDMPRDGVIKYHTILPEDSDKGSEKDMHIQSPIEIKQSPIEINDIEKTVFPKPHKSILKNGHSSCKSSRFIHNEDQSLSPNNDRFSSVCSYQLPNPRNGISLSATFHNSSGGVRVDSIRPRVHSGYVYNTLRRQHSARSSSRVVPVDHDNHIAGVVSDMTARKRSVRFNASHQIHEYKPFDPIANY